MRVTSRAEGSHAVIKKYINLAKCDLLKVQQRLNLMLEAQFTELRQFIEKEKLCVIRFYVTVNDMFPAQQEVLASQLEDSGLNPLLHRRTGCWPGQEEEDQQTREKSLFEHVESSYVN
jgi:hypothetical protein